METFVMESLLRSEVYLQPCVPEHISIQVFSLASGLPDIQAKHSCVQIVNCAHDHKTAFMTPYLFIQRFRGGLEMGLASADYQQVLVDMSQHVLSTPKMVLRLPDYRKKTIRAKELYYAQLDYFTPSGVDMWSDLLR